MDRMLCSAALIIWVQAILLSVAIAIIVYQWINRMPDAINSRLDELAKQRDFLLNVNAQLRLRDDLADLLKDEPSAQSIPKQTDTAENQS